MSRTKTGPSLLAIILHTLLVLMTGGLWLIPLCIWLMLPGTSLFVVALHTFGVLITGGFWLIPLIIWWMLNKKK